MPTQSTTSRARLTTFIFLEPKSSLECVVVAWCWCAGWTGWAGWLGWFSGGWPTWLVEWAGWLVEWPGCWVADSGPAAFFSLSNSKNLGSAGESLSLLQALVHLLPSKLCSLLQALGEEDIRPSWYSWPTSCEGSLPC